MGLGDQAVAGGAEEFLKLGPHAEIPEVRVHGLAAHKREPRAAEHLRDLGEIKARPVFVEVFVDEVAKVLRDERVEVGRGPRVIEEVFRLAIAEEHEIRKGIANPLGAVALTEGGVLPEDATDRLKVSPAGHGVVAHEQEAARCEMPTRHLENLLAHLRPHPAEHAVEGDELKLPEVGRQRRKVAGDHSRVGEAAGGNVAGSRRGVIGIDIDADELTARVGRGERREGAAKATAKLEVAVARGCSRRANAIERGHVPQGHRGHLRIEARDVRDVSDISRSGHAGIVRDAPAARTIRRP